MEAAIWKVAGDSAAEGHLLIDLERFMLDRKLPLGLLPPDAAPLVPDPLPDTLEALADEGDQSQDSWIWISRFRGEQALLSWALVRLPWLPQSAPRPRV